MGSSGRTPTTGQKWLRGKTENLTMAGSIKWPYACTMKQQRGRTVRNIETKREIESKEKQKGKAKRKKRE